MCPQHVQSNLRYNISNISPQLVIPVPADESLPEAICCDKKFLPFAEPQFTFQRPDVDLFSKMNPTGTTIFYDSVCGQPLFEVPKGRTLKEFQDETLEHSWPSFRPEEVIDNSVYIDENNYVFTTGCNIHLGSNVPDEKGIRYCLDISCVSGNPV